jgi:3-deoxy-D-manno-octulosonic acid kinase
MMNGRRVATASGAILADAAVVDGLPALGALFEPKFWAGQGRITPVGGGRGAAWFIDHGTEQWVLRHYRRGGLVARLSEDRYLWTGEARVRAFAEFRLLTSLAARNMPVPVPIAARYQRRGLWYRCDLITRRIPGAASLSAVLAAAPLADASWRRMGWAIAGLHAAGVDHADLNAHNILLDEQGTVSIVDFDRGRVRRAGAWARRNLSRLRRSLAKISGDLPADRFPGEAWRCVLAGYAERAAAHAERAAAHAERAAADE